MVRKICKKNLETKNFKLKGVDNPKCKSDDIFDTYFNSKWKEFESLFESDKKMKALLKDTDNTDEDIFNSFCEAFGINKQDIIDWNVKRNIKKKVKKLVVKTITDKTFEINL